MEPTKSNRTLFALVTLEAALLFVLGMVGNKLSERTTFSTSTLVLLAVVLVIVAGIIVYLKVTNFSLGNVEKVITGVRDGSSGTRSPEKSSDELFESRLYLSLSLSSVLFVFAVPMILPAIRLWGAEWGLLYWCFLMLACAYVGSIPICLLPTGESRLSGKIYVLLFVPLLTGAVSSSWVICLWSAIVLIAKFGFGVNFE